MKRGCPMKQKSRLIGYMFHGAALLNLKLFTGNTNHLSLSYNGENVCCDIPRF